MEMKRLWSSILLACVVVSGSWVAIALSLEPSRRAYNWRWCTESPQAPYCGFVKEEYQSGDIDGLVYLLTLNPDRPFSTFFPSVAMLLAEFERLHPELRVLEFSATDVAGGRYKILARDSRSG